MVVCAGMWNAFGATGTVSYNISTFGLGFPRGEGTLTARRTNMPPSPAILCVVLSDLHPSSAACLAPPTIQDQVESHSVERRMIDFWPPRHERQK